MPIAKKLILISASEVVLKDKKSGENKKKWKYIFLKEPGTYPTEKEKYIIAWDDLGFYQDDVQEVQAWDSEKAKYFPFDITTYQGNVVEKLSTGKSLSK